VRSDQHLPDVSAQSSGLGVAGALIVDAQLAFVESDCGTPSSPGGKGDVANNWGRKVCM
jgi:hypothetical protein